MTIEGLKLLFQNKKRQFFSKRMRNKLKNTDFTIISNNCWGGMVYEYYNLQKKSPTVGLFFMSSDYIKFLSNLQSYLTSKIEFIKAEDSKYRYLFLGDKKYGHYPIGKLTNGNEEIEIFFMHARNEDEALEKWAKRCKRINFKKIIIKFNDQNGAKEEDVKAFSKLPYQNKIFFTINKEWAKKYGGYYIKQLSGKSIKTSNEPVGDTRIINLTNIINNL